MAFRDYIAWAADQYGTDRGLLDNIARLESGYNPTAQNNWDSNAKAGTPSYGAFQFIQPTFQSYSRQAAQANPNAWRKFGGQFDWKNPQQQALTTAWAIKNGHGSAWSTYDRAQAAVPDYSYNPKWNTKGVAAVNQSPYWQNTKNDYADAIEKQNAIIDSAKQRVGKFDNLTEDQKRALGYQGTFREFRNQSLQERAANLDNHPVLEQVAQMKKDAIGVLKNARQTKADLIKASNALDTAMRDEVATQQAYANYGDDQQRKMIVETARTQVDTVASDAMKYIRSAGGTGYEPWCFGAGTLVDTPDGFKPIETIAVGDVVYDATQQQQKVLATFARESEHLRLVALGVDGTIVSPEHPYLARRRLTKLGYPKKYGEPEWIKAGELKRNDLIALTQPVARRDDANAPTEAEAMLIGRWLADGWRCDGHQHDRKHHKRTEWFVCCGHHEVEVVRELIENAGIQYSESEGRTTTNFRLANEPMSRLLEGFGKGCHDKRIPGRVFTWGRDQWMSLLVGYMAGDGCLTNNDATFKANSVNRELVYGIAKIARLLRLIVRITRTERDATAVIEGRVVNQSPVRYELAWSRQDSGQIIEDETITWVPVRSVESVGHGTVYNLTVDGTHTYVADGAAVHNCGDFVQWVFKQRGLKPPPSRSVPQLLSWARDNNRVSQTGRAGDLAMFDWDGDGTPDHVGIVAGGRGNGRYATIEGNTSGNLGGSQVENKIRTGNILGFVNPY